MIDETKFESTALNDDATIYNKNTKTEKENISEMSRKEKWCHFKEYYLGATILIVCAVAAIIFLLYNFIKPDDVCVLNVAVFDERLDDKTREELVLELEDLYGIDGEKEYVFIDDSFYSYDDGYSKLEVYIMNKEIDVVIASPEIFEYLAGCGYFSDLTVLAAESEAELDGTYFEAAGYLEDYEGEDIFEDYQSGRGEVLPYGIELSQSNKYMAMASNQTQPVAGIIRNSQNPEKAVAFLELLLRD